MAEAELKVTACFNFMKCVSY